MCVITQKIYLRCQNSKTTIEIKIYSLLIIDTPLFEFYFQVLSNSLKKLKSLCNVPFWIIIIHSLFHKWKKWILDGWILGDRGALFLARVRQPHTPSWRLVRSCLISPALFPSEGMYRFRPTFSPIYSNSNLQSPSTQ